MDTLDFMGCLAFGFSGCQEKHVELVELGSVHWAKTSKNMAPKKQQNSPATSPQKGLTPHFRIHGFSQNQPKKQQQTNLPFSFHFPVPGEINHPSAQVISSAKVLLLALRSEPKNRSVWPLPRLAAGARRHPGGWKDVICWWCQMNKNTSLKGQEPTLSYLVLKTWCKSGMWTERSEPPRILRIMNPWMKNHCELSGPITKRTRTKR